MGHKGTLYLAGQWLQDASGARVEVPAETLVALFTLQYCQSQCIHVVLVPSRVDPKTCKFPVSLDDLCFCVEVKGEEACPEVLSHCELPAMIPTEEEEREEEKRRKEEGLKQDGALNKNQDIESEKVLREEIDEKERDKEEVKETEREEEKGKKDDLIMNGNEEINSKGELGQQIKEEEEKKEEGSKEDEGEIKNMQEVNENCQGKIGENIENKKEEEEEETEEEKQDGLQERKQEEEEENEEENKIEKLREENQEKKEENGERKAYTDTEKERNKGNQKGNENKEKNDSTNECKKGAAPDDDGDGFRVGPWCCAGLCSSLRLAVKLATETRTLEKNKPNRRNTARNTERGMVGKRNTIYNPDTSTATSNTERKRRNRRKVASNTDRGASSKHNTRNDVDKNATMINIDARQSNEPGSAINIDRGAGRKQNTENKMSSTCSTSSTPERKCNIAGNTTSTYSSSNGTDDKGNDSSNTRNTQNDTDNMEVKGSNSSNSTNTTDRNDSTQTHTFNTEEGRSTTGQSTAMTDQNNTQSNRINPGEISSNTCNKDDAQNSTQRTEKSHSNTGVRTTNTNSKTGNTPHHATALLGFRGGCLQACAEVSVWTKFCEVEAPAALLSLALAPYTGNNAIEYPSELLRYECHLRRPPILHNALKRTQRHIKETVKDGTERDELMRRPLALMPPLSHQFAEGPDMTLADLMLFSCFHLLLVSLTALSVEPSAITPLVSAWHGTLVANRHIQMALPVLEGASTLFCGTPKPAVPPQVVVPSVPDVSIYKSDPERYRTTRGAFTRQGDVEEVLRVVEEAGVEPQYITWPPCSTSSSSTIFSASFLTPSSTSSCNVTSTASSSSSTSTAFSSSKLPALHTLLPELSLEGHIPESRLARKVQQVENVCNAVLALARPGDVIVDFCSGGGHVGIPLAQCLPGCLVLLVENKVPSLERARERVRHLHLKNVWFVQSNLDYFRGRFDIGVSLHACGAATDLVLGKCVAQGAAFVVAPCCYGSIRPNHVVSYPRSQSFCTLPLTIDQYLTLGHAADQTHGSDNPKTEQGQRCMKLVDGDRLAAVREVGYVSGLALMQPPTCSPKNHLLLGKVTA